MDAALPTALSPVARFSSCGHLPQGTGLSTPDGPPAFLPSVAMEDADPSNLSFLTGQ